MAPPVLGRPLCPAAADADAGLPIHRGPPPTARQLVGWCRAHPEIKRVVLTHHHEDHVGGAAALQKELGLPVSAPATAVAILAGGLRMPPYRKAVWGTPRR